MVSMGEFSKIAQVPASLLRYYDQIGFFMPETTDPSTGYRFYHARQLKSLNRILALKELGLSLEQIKRLLQENIADDEIRGMFTRRKAQVEQNLYAEMARLRTIESRLRHLDHADEMPGFDVVVKAIPSQTILSVRDTYPTPKDAFAVVNEMHRLVPERVNQKGLGYMVAVVHDQFFALENIDIEIGFQYMHTKETMVPLSAAREMKVRELASVETAVTTVWVGGVDRHLSYGALGLWMEANDYRFDGPPREIVLEQTTPNRIQEAIVEIQFPVTKLA